MEKAGIPLDLGCSLLAHIWRTPR